MISISYALLKKKGQYTENLRHHGVYAPELQLTIRLMLALAYIFYYTAMPDTHKIFPFFIALTSTVIFISIHAAMALYASHDFRGAPCSIRYGNILDLLMAHVAWLSDPITPSPLLSFISLAVIGNGMQLGLKTFWKNAPACLLFSVAVLGIRAATYGFSTSEFFLLAFQILLMCYAYMLLANIDRLKKKIEFHRNSLEQIVIERTADLQKSNELLREEIKSRKTAEREARQKQAQLLQTTRMASLGTLLAGLAHEINNPVAIISMNISSIKKFSSAAIKIMDDCFRDKKDSIVLCNMKYDEVRSRFPKMIEGLDEGITRVTKLVEDLKAYARQEPAIFFEPVDLSSVLSKALRLTNSIIKKSTRHFSVEISTPLPTVNGDMHKIEQVIINLITNACQALENSEQAISLKTGVMSESGNEPGMVFVCVTDEGKGMSRAVMERIKTPFFTTRRHKDGTGLGLSISDTIIREHGGTLEFESSPGKGTTATILLPVSR